MAKKKVFAVKFATTDKSRIHGKVGHTRTGACTSRGKCNHGWKPRVKKSK